MMLVLCVLEIAFFVTTVTANFTCYTCSYQHPATRDSVCVTRPDEVSTAKSVLCPTERLCVTREVYSKALRIISSFNRDCQFPTAGLQTECDSSGDTTVCTYVCRSDFCNNQLGGQVETAVNRQLSADTTDDGQVSNSNVAKLSYSLSRTIPEICTIFFILWFV